MNDTGITAGAFFLGRSQLFEQSGHGIFLTEIRHSQTTIMESASLADLFADGLLISDTLFGEVFTNKSFTGKRFTSQSHHLFGDRTNSLGFC